MTFRPVKYALAAMVIGCLTALPAMSASNAPQQVIEQTASVLLSVMKDVKMLGFDGRFQRLAPIVQSVFNLPLMAQITTGAYWAKATEDQRNRLVQAFGKMTVATLAARFDAYSGEKFDIIGTEEQSPNTALVKTQVVQGNGDTIPINYLLQNSAGE